MYFKRFGMIIIHSCIFTNKHRIVEVDFWHMNVTEFWILVHSSCCLSRMSDSSQQQFGSHPAAGPNRCVVEEDAIIIGMLDSVSLWQRAPIGDYGIRPRHPHTPSRPKSFGGQLPAAGGRRQVGARLRLLGPLVCTLLPRWFSNVERRSEAWIDQTKRQNFMNNFEYM